MEASLSSDSGPNSGFEIISDYIKSFKSLCEERLGWNHILKENKQDKVIKEA